jgi:P27 family predicted phage terminase small subunit
MAGQKQPIELVKFKGRKNLTKKEIKEREESEVKAPKDKIKIPSGLDKDVRKRFKKYADDLEKIDIMTNLDIHALQRYCESEKLYDDVTKELLETPATLKSEEYDEKSGEFYEDIVINEVHKELTKIRKTYVAECHTLAGALGLTISSRCRLVVPKKDEEKKVDPKKARFGNV